MRYTPGGQLFLKVLDFGIAKQIGDATVQGKLTATGAVMGTPAYMPPEQAGGKQIDARADQYATGVVLYELLTGSVPFTGETLTGVLVSHLTKPPPPLPRAVPEPLRRVVMRLLEKHPEDRYPDAAALDQALAACESACRDVPALTLGSVKPLVAGGVQSSSSGTRQLMIVGSGVLLSLLLLAVVVVSGMKRHRLRDAQPRPVETTAGKVVAANPPAAQPVANPQPVASPQPVANPQPAAPTAKPAAGKPAHTAPTHSVAPAAGPEPPEVKELLDEAAGELKSGNFQKVVDLARRTTFTTPTARAYRLLVDAYCNMGDLQGAKAAFHRVAGADRRALTALCRKHDIDLP